MKTHLLITPSQGSRALIGRSRLGIHCGISSNRRYSRLFHL